MRATQGRIQEAIEDQQRAIAAKEKSLGPDDPDVAISIGNAANYLDELGDTARAADYGARAIKIMEATLGLDHPLAAIDSAHRLRIAEPDQGLALVRILDQQALEHQMVDTSRQVCRATSAPMPQVDRVW
jgi:tetratricopeptide (TPR) repeat protein